MRRTILITMLAAALGAVTASPVVAVTRTIERVPWTVTFPADVTCTGEAVAVTGLSTVVTVEAADGTRFHTNGHVVGDGIGLTTGDRYRFTWTQAITSADPSAPTYVYTERYITSLRHLGPDGAVAADSRSDLLLRYTIVGGRTVVGFELYGGGCR